MQWQGSARILLHPSPSSNIRKGQDPPTSQSNHFFRFGTNNDINVELQRSVLALRALYIDYFIIKTGKIDASPRQKKGIYDKIGRVFSKFRIAENRDVLMLL